ncbi:MAG: hypothetical protein JWO30_3618 [Fibrobacteres bacterium]|nr:hypothetical protein [Fibrobacterota bacterium]
MENVNTYTAFEGHKLVSQGPLPEVILGIKRRIGKAENSSTLVFSDATGNTMDFNFQGTEKDVLKRLEVFVREDGPESSGPGRPRLGVVSREVSLLPRQWEWLASQSGGASAVLRRLVDEAKKKSLEGNSIKQIQEKAYKFMFAVAGDLKGYEEAIRALYKKDKKNFLLQMEDWPHDVKAHALDLANPVFEGKAK